MKRIVTVGIVAMMMASLSACGGGNDDEEASKNISAAIMKSQDDSDSSMISVPQKDADCIGEGLVDKIGTEQLQEYKLIDEDLKTNEDLDNVDMSAEDAESAADVLTDCTDMQKMILDGMGDQLGSLPQEAQDCINDALSEDALHDVFAAVFQGDDEEAQKVLTEPMQECVTAGLQ